MFGYEEKDVEITKVWYKICRNFFVERSNSSSQQGIVKKQVEMYIAVMTVVKLCNIETHLSKSDSHNKAVTGLSDDPPDELKDLFNERRETGSCSRQLTLSQTTSTQNTWKDAQLFKKFQLAHHVATSALPFSAYESFGKFEKDIHGVDLGHAYMNRKDCAEIISYLPKTDKIDNVTSSLNDGRSIYYSVLSDGSSNAKTMDEKELILIKTCAQGTPKFHGIRSGGGR